MKIWSLVPQWAFAYQVPEPVIVSQIYIAHAWCDSNPLKAPKKLITRFLASWMGQAKRWGNLRAKEPPKPKLEPLPEPDMTFDEMQAIRRRNMGAGHV